MVPNQSENGIIFSNNHAFFFNHFYYFLQTFFFSNNCSAGGRHHLEDERQQNQDGVRHWEQEQLPAHTAAHLRLSAGLVEYYTILNNITLLEARLAPLVTMFIDQNSLFRSHIKCYKTILKATQLLFFDFLQDL